MALAFAPFAFRAVVALGLIWVIGRVLPGLGLFGLALILLALGLGIAIPDLRAAALRRGQRLREITEAGRLRDFFGGGFLRVLLIGAAGALAALLVLLRLPDLRALDWALLVLAFPLAWGLQNLGAHLLSGDVSAAYLRRWAFALARIAAVLVLMAAQLANAFWAAVPDAAPIGLVRSPLLAELLDFSRLWGGLADFAFGRASEFAGLGQGGALFVLALLETGFWWSIVSLALALCLPLPEALRGFARASDAEDPPTPGRLGCAAVFLLGATLFGAGYTADRWLAQTRPEARPAAHFAVAVELIAGEAYRPGTSARLAMLRSEARHETDLARGALAAALNRGFDAMAANVDPFLDDYYSLTAEYLRMFYWATGGLEAHLTTRLLERLQEDAPFTDFEELRSALTEVAEARLARLEAMESEVLDAGRLSGINPARLRVTGEFAAFEPMRQFLAADISRAQIRWGASAGTGLLAAGMAQRIVTRIAARGVIRIGARMALRAAGLLVALGVDAAMIELDEYLNRDEMRAEIMAAIEAQRQEALAPFSQAEALAPYSSDEALAPFSADEADQR